MTLCRGDWWWVCRVRALCPWDWHVSGLSGGCAVVIGGESAVWVALCDWDWLGGGAVGSAAPL